MESITVLLCARASVGCSRNLVSRRSISARSAAASSPSGNIAQTIRSITPIAGESSITTASLYRVLVRAIDTMVIVLLMKLNPIIALSE